MLMVIVSKLKPTFYMKQFSFLTKAAFAVFKAHPNSKER